MVVSEGKILFVGKADEAQVYRQGKYETVDLKSQTVHYYVRYPGTQKPTGYLYENKGHTVANAMPFNTISQVSTHLENALNTYNRMGFTAVFDAGDVYKTPYPAVAQLQKRGKLNLYYQKAYWADLTLSVAENMHRLKELDKAYTQGNFYCNVYKMFEDGTIEVESASLLEPYSNSGKMVQTFFSEEQSYEHASAALKAGYGVHAHAIGDKAQQTILKTFLKTQEINPHLPRAIAHNQVFEPDCIAKYVGMKHQLFCQSTPSWAVPEAMEETLSKLGTQRNDLNINISAGSSYVRGYALL